MSKTVSYDNVKPLTYEKTLKDFQICISVPFVKLAITKNNNEQLQINPYCVFKCQQVNNWQDNLGQ